MTDKIDRIPRHVAIIMDGNGRWAKQQGKERTYGHYAGAQTVHRVIEQAARRGVSFLTLYTFSTENWNRPEAEITALMQLLLESVEEETLMKNNIRFRVIGDMNQLPAPVQESMGRCMDRTARNTGMTLTLALSYSSRWELTEAMKQLAQKVATGELQAQDITDRHIDEHLNTSFMPDPDLLIRTGGEMRLSNYLLWQCAYSELYFCDTYWPDFDEACFDRALEEFTRRERRFGQTSEQISVQQTP